MPTRYSASLQARDIVATDVDDRLSARLQFTRWLGVGRRATSIGQGVIRGKTTTTEKRVDFQAFMDEVIAELPAGREIHVVLDNFCTHRKNEEWLAAHPNVSFHFTPTSASWLNQVEIWFGIFSRKALAGASFRNVEQLVQAISDFM